jgi:hypothetical protein
MGRETYTESSYTATRASRGVTGEKHVTREAEQKVKKTGKLNPSVDPSVDPIRRSLVRFDPVENGFEVTVGCPMDVESICDTTGSMGHNVDVAMNVLPDTYELVSSVLPGYDPQFALGIFGDRGDDWILQRPQFEMTAKALVDYLADMAPERQGGDTPEDPQYGIFGAVYLTDPYTNRIGLKGYHFVISDATEHGYVTEDGLERVFGDKVWERVAENGHQLNKQSLPDTKELVRSLKKRAHAFFLQVGDSSYTESHWRGIYGSDRVIQLPDTKYLPHVQATIIGLTEGTLGVSEVEDFLTKNNLSTDVAKSIARAVANIPVAEQAKLREKLEHPVPKAGDIFADKADLWPINPDEIPAKVETEDEPKPAGWL